MLTAAQWVMAFWMLVTGSINTISTKFADLQCVPDLRNSLVPVNSCSNFTAHPPLQDDQCPTGLAPSSTPISCHLSNRQAHPRVPPHVERGKARHHRRFVPPSLRVLCCEEAKEREL
jgi:hypothetical protein